MTEEDSLLNQQLDEYEVLSLLGRGGMARVYRGVDTRLNRYVAIKVIEKLYRDDPEYVKRFEREAQVIAGLQHPNVVQLYRYGEAQGFLYMVMQYIDGADLAAILRGYTQQATFMEPQDVLKLMSEICQALDYIHQHGVIHRDIKPSNIMLDKEGRAYLADFGLSLLTDVGTRGEVFGTPQYIAPEQAISSANAQPSSDLYAMGVILYEIFTGQLPFSSTDALELAMMHISDTPPAPRSLRPQISPELEAVILKALEKDPQDRYPSGAELVKALGKALFGAAQKKPSIAEQVLARSVLLPPPQQALLQMQQQPRPQPAKPEAPADQPIPPTQRAPVEGVGYNGGVDYNGVDYNGVEYNARENIPGTNMFQAGAIPPIAAAPVGAPTPATALELEAAEPPSTASRPTPPGQAKKTSFPLWAGIAALVGLPLLALVGCLAGVLIFNMFSGNAAPKSSAAPTIAAAGVAKTAAPSASPAATGVAGGGTVFKLTLLALKDGLVIYNEGPDNFVLGPLQIGSGSQQIVGADWGTKQLDAGQCVVAASGNKKFKLPKSVKCNPVETLSGQDGGAWSDTFEVYYNGEQVGTCQEGSDSPCTVEITAH